MGLATVMARCQGRRQRHRERQRQWRDIEEGSGGAEGGGSGVKGGGGVEGGKIGQPDDTKPNFTAIRVSRWRGYSPYTRYIISIG
jgi:hypothetical protein